jgi:hypothetical protein
MAASKTVRIELFSVSRNPNLEERRRTRARALKY